MIAVKLFVFDFFRVLVNYYTYLPIFIGIPLVGCIIGNFLNFEFLLSVNGFLRKKYRSQETSAVRVSDPISGVSRPLSFLFCILFKSWNT